MALTNTSLNPELGINTSTSDLEDTDTLANPNFDEQELNAYRGEDEPNNSLEWNNDNDELDRL